MAFTQETFATVGAQATDTPTVYSYKTDDTISQVRTDGYFTSKQFQLDVGDVVIVNASDGSDILQIESPPNTGKTAPFISSINKRTIINSPSDFPDAVGGVITLASNTEYLIGDDINVGSNRFTVGSGTVIRGVLAGTLLTSETTGAMFTGADVDTFIIDRIGIDCPNGTVYDFIDVGSGTNLLATSVRFVSCKAMGTIDVTSLTLTLVSMRNADTGFTVNGTNNAFFIRDVTFVTTQATGKFLNIGSSTFAALSYTAVTFVGPSGSYAISGVANSANINSGVIASVKDSSVSGGGLMLENITSDDFRWSFINNAGVPDTNPDALVSVSGNALATNIVTQSVGVDINASFSVNRESHFSADSSGQITYLGERTLALPVDIDVGLLSAAGTFDASVQVAINGTSIAEGVAVAINTSKPTLGRVSFQHNFQNGDILTARVANKDGTTDIVAQSVTVRVR